MIYLIHKAIGCLLSKAQDQTIEEVKRKDLTFRTKFTQDIWSSLLEIEVQSTQVNLKAIREL